MNRIVRYSSLARQLSALELANLAARRAYRAARKAFYRESSTNELRLLNSFGVKSRAQLAERALSWRAGRSWAETAQRTRVLAALQRLPAAQERALARAETAYHRTFDVFGNKIAFGRSKDVDWPLDVVSGYRYPLTPVQTLSLNAGRSDPKFPWVLGRLDSLIALGQGYWASPHATDRLRYADEFAAQTLSFLEANPAGLGIHWACPMEVALRGANLAQALLMFADAPCVNDPDFICKTLLSLAEHAHYVDAHLEDEGAVPNNHLLANYVGLFVMGLLFPELPNAARHVVMAANGLREQLRTQVHSDGCSFEGSVPYHRLAVELFTLAHLTAAANGVDLGSEFDARLERMYAVAEAYTSPSGLAPQLGDNDSGRVFAFTDRESLDHGYLPSLGAAIFGTPSLKREDAEFPDEALWLLGITGLSRFEAVPAKAPKRAFTSIDGGLHVLKSDNLHVAISAGANGQKGIGGHSHNDKLSFELHLRGQPVIVDPGSPTHTREPHLRNQFRSTFWHNTPQIDGQEQAPLSRWALFALPDAAGCQMESLSTAQDADVLIASHKAFSPIEIRRTFTLHKKVQALTVTDVFRGKGRHLVENRLYLPDGEARIREATPEELTRAESLVPHAALNGQVVVLGPAQAPRAIVLFDQGLSVSLEDAHYSSGYGQMTLAKRVVFRSEAELPAARVLMVLVP